MRGEGYSLSDIAAATGNGNGFGGGEYSLWWVIIIIILFGGWNRNGFGGGSGVQDSYVLTSDFSQLSKQISDTYNMTDRKFEGIANGLCDGFYTNAQLINGVNTNILTTGNGINSKIADVGFGIQNATNQIVSQIADNKYEMAKGFCATNNAITMSSRDIIDQMNANYRAIHDELVANKLELKNDRIAELNSQVSALQLAASQERQNNYLVNELRPCPRPAYITCNPYASVNYCNCNNGCGM